VSIKDLFGKKSFSTTTKEYNSDDFQELESYQYAEQIDTWNQRFVPDIDYTQPENFARYGLAEKYYVDAIQDIYKSYPYDGSLYEKKKWQNDRGDLVNYFFDYLYPRKNGFINIGYEYGNSSTSDSGYEDTDRDEYIFLKGTYNLNNIYDPTKNREYNLKLDGDNGATVEFYFKKDNALGSPKQVIFDLWNSSSEGTDSYGRFKIEVHPGLVDDRFYVEVSSGSAGVVNASIGSGLNFSGSWHHYGIAVQNSGSQLKLQLFVDGDLVNEELTGSAISQVRGPLIAHIGSLVTAASGSSTAKGWGKLSGSLDEFRYWKEKRTDKEIARNYFNPVGGGTNTDDANTTLGVYYKFNEGIYDTENISSYDKIVLDYSGRTTNGDWTGYSVGSRNTGSAIVLGGFADEEFADPIVYSGHPEVQSLLEEYSAVGFEYDTRNNANLYYTLPSWMIDEDQEKGKLARDLFQIISYYFDDLHNKIKFLPTIKTINYDKKKAFPFSLRLLDNVGFESIDIFSQATQLENFLSRNETQNYDESLQNIKNFIYQNIYNNILQIYRSKGTEKSFRNLMHCFGVGEDLIKINVYADNVEYDLKNRFKYSLVKTNTINFNDTESFGGNIYQKQDGTVAESLGYIPASTDIKTLGTTFETEVIFPKKFDVGETFFFPANFLTSSLFGIHESTDGTFATTDRASIQVFAVRPKLESRDVCFQLSSSYLGINLTSSLYDTVYEDNKWNFALRIKPEGYPDVGLVSGAVINNYDVELYGVSYHQDIEEEVLLISTTVTSSLMDDFYAADKMIYGGAHRQNFSGSIIDNQYSDVEIVSMQYWHSYLENDTIAIHAKDSSVYGADDYNYQKAIQRIQLADSASYGEQYLPQNKTLALYWNFNNIGTLSGGEFSIVDATSGSLADVDLLSPYTKYKFTGTGDNFESDTVNVINKQYINSAKLKSPESINSNDLIEILEEDDELFTRDSKPVNHYFLLEKNMYATMSEDMLQWLGTATKFNNLIGQPKYRYEEEYRELEKLRELFFQNIENEPDFEKFLDFYKWIDNSISAMFEQLVPISMDTGTNVYNVVESHLLERNKYRHKLPTVEFKGQPLVGATRGINEMLYPWSTGHAPVTGQENTNCVWWNLRAERTEITNGNINIDLNEKRVGIFQTSLTALNRKFSTVYNYGVDLAVANDNETIRNDGTPIDDDGAISLEFFSPVSSQVLEIGQVINPTRPCDDE
jgi:hypothetical protein